MRKSRTLFVFIAIFTLLNSIPVGAASLGGSAADQPWEVQTIDSNEPGVINLSSAYGGKSQIPMFSYYSKDTEKLFLVHKETAAVPGNIGPDSSWVRVNIPITAYDLMEGTISNMTTFHYGLDTFGIKWVFATIEENLYGKTHEFQNDMSPVSGSLELLIDLDKFGEYLVGAPSLQTFNGWFRLAFAISDSSGEFKLVYMHRTNELNNSCLQSGSSYYQCDVIDTSFNWIGPPSLQVTPKGRVGIAYQKYEDLLYAYPHEHLDLFPSNCGPGNPKTWRCIPIYDDSHVGSVVKLALGQTRGRGILYRDSEALSFAQYVGSGGNCGWDGHNLTKDYQWYCHILFGFTNNSNPSYSIAIDSNGYPVIAYDIAYDDLGPRTLKILYQLGHIGLEPSNSWQSEVIDPAPNMDVDNGRGAAIALNNLGMGFIAYMQDDNWDPYNPIERLKIAIQPIFRSYLPMIVD